MTRFNKPTQRWRVVAKRAGFHHSIPRWRIFARAIFELMPDQSERIFIGGDNVRLAACSLTGWGYVHFQRPLNSPVLRAYTKDILSPVQLVEITRYAAKFKIAEWPLDTSLIEELIFECPQTE